MYGSAQFFLSLKNGLCASQSIIWLSRVEEIGRCFASGEAGYFPYQLINRCHLIRVGMQGKKTFSLRFPLLDDNLRKATYINPTQPYISKKPLK